jgi:hypothetical protein
MTSRDVVGGWRDNDDPSTPRIVWPADFGHDPDTTIPPGPVTDLDLPAIGSEVTHFIHGTGTVIEHANVHAEPEVTVDFGKAGVKRLLLRYASLSQVEKSGYKLTALDAEKYDAEVKEALHLMKVRKAALELLRAESEPPAPPFDAGLLGEILARPPDPPMRVDGLIPWDSSALVVAARKTGKTTLDLNLTRCLLTGDDFLGRSPVRPIEGIVGILNFEVSAAMLGRWADEHGIDRERFYMVNLRGRRNPFTHPHDRAVLAEDLAGRGVESLIVDPFGRAYPGKSQNDPGEVGAWLVDLDKFARGEVGAKDVILSAHAGWNGERTRGSSALEDWADVILTMTRDSDDDSLRFLKAEGRDVDLAEDQLVFDQSSRTLSLAGTGSRKKGKDDRKLTELAVLTVRAAHTHPGIGTAEMVKAIREMEDAPSFHDRDGSRAARKAAELGHLRLVGGGPGRKTSHYPTALAGGQT